MAKKSNVVDFSGGVANFKEAVEAVQPQKLVSVHFWTDWAEQCKAMDEAVDILAGERDFKDDVVFFRVEAEAEAEISMEFEVAAVPTFLFFFGGSSKVIERVEGAKVADVTKKVRDLASKAKTEALNKAAKAVKAPEALFADETDLNARLQKLTTMAEVVLFMKGSPLEPKCGFSRQTVELLSGLDAEYAHFDIFKDEKVRQGLKEFSNRPTYPQLYVKGELVGGLDILKELHEAGELKDMLPTKGQSLNQRLKALINKAKVMVFMKGNRQEPRCGFSRQLIEILSEMKAEYETFDILSDEDVRQGLKKYSDWPTYPQLYVNGELVGGLDIIKELKEGGELQDTLKG